MGLSHCGSGANREAARKQRSANPTNRKRSLASQVAHEPARRHTACATTGNAGRVSGVAPRSAYFKKAHTAIKRITSEMSHFRIGYIGGHREATLMKMYSRVEYQRIDAKS